MEKMKMTNAEMPSEQENTRVRLEYHTPVLEEQGNLHELTHGIGDHDDDGGAGGYFTPG